MNYGSPNQQDNLQFYTNAYSDAASASPNASYSMNTDYYGTSTSYPPIPPAKEIDFYAAFGTGGYPGEPPLLEGKGECQLR
jgi:hypothetical protein